MNPNQVRLEAIEAFAKGRHISSTDRRRFQSVFGRHHFYHSWETVKAYAFGELEEFGEDLDLIISAWLHFGETLFQLMIRIARAIKEAVAHGEGAFDELVSSLQSMHNSYKRRDIRRSLETVWRKVWREFNLQHVFVS